MINKERLQTESIVRETVKVLKDEGIISDSVVKNSCTKDIEVPETAISYTAMGKIEESEPLIRTVLDKFLLGANKELYRTACIHDQFLGILKRFGSQEENIPFRQLDMESTYSNKFEDMMFNITQISSALQLVVDYLDDEV